MEPTIQGITINELFGRYRNNEDFIKYIFPGGFLPSMNFIKELTQKPIKPKQSKLLFR